MMKSVIVILLMALMSGPAQDCAAAGPYVEDGQASEAPVIFDQGSSVTTNGAGCDGCTLTSIYASGEDTTVLLSS